MAHVIKAHVHIHHHIQHLSVFGRLHKQASQIAVQRVEHRSDRIHNYEQSVPFKRMQSHAAEHEHNAVVRHDVGPVQSNQCRRVPAYRRQQSILFGTAASGFALGCTAVLAHAEYWLLQSARVRVKSGTGSMPGGLGAILRHQLSTIIMLCSLLPRRNQPHAHRCVITLCCSDAGVFCHMQRWHERR